MSTHTDRPKRSHRAKALCAPLLVGAVMAAGACAPGTSASEGAGEPANAEAIAEFRSQQLDFGSCEGKAPSANEEAAFVDPFECAWMEVPLDYRDPGGKKAQIGVMKLEAKGAPEEKLGTIVVNPGGPGGSGMMQAAQAAAGLNGTDITRRFDIVGFDPRGVGASTPAIDCFSDAERDAGEDQTTLLGTSGSWTSGDTEELKNKCAEGSGGEDVLGAVGTRNVARDMDVLREVLGEEKLNFMGQSYGTRLGAVYAEMFGANVRAMMLDGVIDPAMGTAERRIELHAGFQRSFEKMAESCAKQADCPLGTDPERATEQFQKIMQPLARKPVPTEGGRLVGFHQGTGGVLGGLYYSEVWPGIIEGLRQVKDEGRGDKLLQINDAFGTRAPNGEWSNQTEANLVVNCNDEQRLSPEETDELRQEIARVNPILDPGTDLASGGRDACEHWPSEPSLGFPYAQDVTDMPEALIVSITGDPVTPYPAGQSIAEDIGGRILTVDGETHTTAMSGASECVTDAVNGYFVSGELPPEGARCAL